MKSFNYYGTVSSGSMREEDLISVFLEVLIELDTDHEYESVIREGEQIMELFHYSNENWIEITHEGWNQISLYLNEDLWNAMDSFSPEGYYFGSHPGDGADYGFWEIEEYD